MNTLGRLRKTCLAGLLVIYANGVLMAFCQDGSSGAFYQIDATRADSESHFVSIRGLRLQYVDWGGRGESLIFIPGGCDSAFVFGDIAPKLAQHFRVLGLTARGCGASDRPATGYDMSHQIGDILGFMDALGIERCTLIGHSSGGGKVTQFAHSHPERVNRLVYLDTVFGYVAPGFEDKIDAQIEKVLGGHPMDSLENWKKTEKMWELGARSVALDRNFEEIYSVAPDGRVKERYETPSTWRTEVDKDMQAGLYTDTHITQSALMIFAMDTDRDRARQFPKQARRELEPLVRLTEEHRREEIEKFRSNGSNIRVVTLPHTSHYCFVQRPETVIHLIESFLTGPIS
jgi:pimeloyl-ACP methyl ester carboxylesterase